MSETSINLMAPVNNQFDHRPLTQISAGDIVSLVDDQIPEAQQLEYKSMHWSDDADGKCEALHDITGMANSDGGYIIVGITTSKSGSSEVATGYRSVDDSARVVQRLTSWCQDSIDPQIYAELEIKERAVSTNSGEKNLICIHVPASDNRPHSYRCGGATSFVKRVGDDVLPMSTAEIGRMLSRAYSPQTETNRHLAELSQELRDLGSQLLARDDGPRTPLTVSDPDELIDLMARRAREGNEDG